MYTARDDLYFDADNQLFRNVLTIFSFFSFNWILEDLNIGYMCWEKKNCCPLPARTFYNRHNYLLQYVAFSSYNGTFSEYFHVIIILHNSLRRDVVVTDLSRNCRYNYTYGGVLVRVRKLLYHTTLSAAFKNKKANAKTTTSLSISIRLGYL